ncbi:MAG TPA: DUF2924 domain-containing protein [Gemmataceae bacterium]|nr:DUF2924 domain-containing protein [Gemmataceae bacterium]
MDPAIAKEVAALPRLSFAQLRARYAQLFHEPTRVGNRSWLVRRIAWRLQALAEGDLSDRARHYAEQIVNDADLRLLPPKAADLTQPAAVKAVPKPVHAPQPNSRLPPPGSLITRLYKGQTLQVEVLPAGFAYQGTVYASLSAVAKAITGSHCSGFLFFHLHHELNHHRRNP